MKIGCKRESNVRKEFFSGMQSALVENREVSYFQSPIKFMNSTLYPMSVM